MPVALASDLKSRYSAAYDGLIRPFELSNTDVYVDKLKKILCLLAPHRDSPDLQQTFYDTLNLWENIVFSYLATPAMRYKYVEEVLAHIAMSPKGREKLSKRMYELKADVAYVCDGTPIILNDDDRLADQIATETMAFKRAAQPVNIKDAVAGQHGIPSDYRDAFYQINQALNKEDYVAVQNGLSRLFKNIDADREEIDDYSKIAPVLTFWLKTAMKLQYTAPLEAGELAWSLMYLQDDHMMFGEQSLTTLYAFALSTFSLLEVSDKEFQKMAVSVYKKVMMATSEFGDQELAMEVFEQASTYFYYYLGRIDPSRRYYEVVELEAWLEGRKHPSEMLQGFVDEMMNARVGYDGLWIIPLEIDIQAAQAAQESQRTAVIYNLRPATVHPLTPR